MDKRKAKVQVSNPGGNASTGSRRYTLTLPSVFMKEFGITEDDRDILISFDGNKIIIERDYARIDSIIEQTDFEENTLKAVELIEERSLVEDLIKQIHKELKEIQKNKKDSEPIKGMIQKLYKYHVATNEQKLNHDQVIADLIILLS